MTHLIQTAEAYNKLMSKYKKYHCSNVVPNSVSEQYSYILRDSKGNAAKFKTIREAQIWQEVFSKYEPAEAADGEYYLCTNTPSHHIAKLVVYSQAEKL